MAGIRVPTYERQTQFVSPYRAPTATAEQMGAGIGKAVEGVGAGITDIGLALMQRQAERQKMEDLNYKQARSIGDNESMYGDFIANRNMATSGAESFAVTSEARWKKLREENDKRLRSEGGYRPSRAAVEEANRSGDLMGSKYKLNAVDFEANARDKKAFDDASLNIQKMQAAAAEYGNLDTASIEMEKALETAKLAMPIETYTALEKAAKAGMGGTVQTYLKRLQDRALLAGSEKERQTFNDEADAHIDAAIARGYMDPATGVEAKRLWKEDYMRRDYPTLPAEERERIGRANLGMSSIKDQLFNRESGGNYANDTNPIGFTGGYQFGAPLLSDLGLYTPGATENLGTWNDTGKNAAGKWSGTFNIPGFPNVKTKGDFLRNGDAQEAAWEVHNAQMDQEIANRGLDAFVGQTIDGIPITVDGIKAAMHLGGANGAEKFLKTAIPAGAGAAAAPADTQFLLSRLEPWQGKEHVTKMDAPLQGGIASLFKAAPPEMAPHFTIGSGTRTNARQQELYEEDIRKGGGKPTGNVARPGHSQHEFGNAADLYYKGERLDKAPKEVIDWVHANAGRFGLNFRLGHEPWHVEMAGGLQSSTDPADVNGTTMSSYLRMGSNSPSYFDAMPQDQMLMQLRDAQTELANQAAANARQWSETQALRKGELSLSIATGKLTSGEVILNDDVLEADDKAELYRSYQSGQKEGAVVRENLAALANGKFKVNTFDPDQTKAGDDVYDQLIKGQDAATQKATASKFAGATGYVPKRVIADILNGMASMQAPAVEEAMTDAERLLKIAPKNFVSGSGKEIREDVAAWNAYQTERGLDAKSAAQKVIDMREVEIAVDDRTREAANKHVQEFAKDVMPAAAEVGIGAEWGSDPIFAAEQMDAFTDDYLDLVYEKLLSTAKMDPVIANAQAVAELKTMWGSTSITGEYRVMRHPPQTTYDPINGTHDYVTRSFNQFAVAEEIPEEASDVQLISTAMTLEDVRNGKPARYMVGWFEHKEGGQRIWQTAPNWFVVDKEEQDKAARIEGTIKERAYRGTQGKADQMAEIMALPPEERFIELQRLRAGGRAADTVEHNLAIREADRRSGETLEARTERTAARQEKLAEGARQQEEFQREQEAPVSDEALEPGAPGTPTAAVEASPPGVWPIVPAQPAAGAEAPTVNLGEKAALVRGLGAKATKRLLGEGGTWEEVVEGIIEHSEIGGSSEQAAARNETHDMQLQAIGIDPRSDRKPTAEKLARGLIDLKQRMQKGGVPQETQDMIIQKVQDTAREMMRGKGQQSRRSTPSIDFLSENSERQAEALAIS